MKYEELTGKIIGCAFKVHRRLGPGFPERFYQKALLIELNKSGLLCGSEIEKKVMYEGVLIGTRRLDVIVNDIILVELKAISELDKACYNKILNYLKIFEIEVGLLFNFGQESLVYKRFVN